MSQSYAQSVEVTATISWRQAVEALSKMLVLAMPGQLCQDDADTFRRMANNVEAKLAEGKVVAHG